MSSLSDSAVDLPLRWRTPESWVETALTDIPSLLSDHAYLERKAASNALDLFNRWPMPGGAEGWSEVLAAIVRDEAQHLDAVLRLMKRRGLRLQRLHKSLYATDLRRCVRRGDGKRELLDRVLVSALIEARSCERFGLLAAHARDAELARFYRSLYGSEAGHYRVFLELGRRVLAADVDARWDRLLDEEAEIIQQQPIAAGLHSGFAHTVSLEPTSEPV